MLTCVAISAMAQKQKPSEADLDKRFEAHHIAFVTTKLNLTSQEAEKFWPIYNKWQQEKKDLRKKQQELDETFTQDSTPTDQEAEKYIAAKLQFKQNELDLVKKYVPELRKALPTTKVAIALNLDRAMMFDFVKRAKAQRKAH